MRTCPASVDAGEAITHAQRPAAHLTRGFYGIIPDNHAGATIRTGAMVYLDRD